MIWKKGQWVQLEILADYDIGAVVTKKRHCITHLLSLALVMVKKTPHQQHHRWIELLQQQQLLLNTFQQLFLLSLAKKLTH